MSFHCEIVADSRNTFGDRLTTYLLTFPRYILAELNTHRLFTRNSASSRAIPFKKALASIWKHPFVPIRWMKDHSGMQGTVYLEGFRRFVLRNLWLLLRVVVICFAWTMNKIGLSKQICNRLLEPWMWHTALVTATEFDNFFFLRASPHADIHIQEIAYMMLSGYNKNIPTQLNEGEWHIPFLDKIDPEKLKTLLIQDDGKIDEGEWLQNVIKISTAMCARTSYTVVGENSKKQDYMKDILLHNNLSSSGHWSPFEHCAKPMNSLEYENYSRTTYFDNQENANAWYKSMPRRKLIFTKTDNGKYIITGIENGWCGNFRGFIQYRKFFNNESALDERIIQPNKMQM